MNSAETSQPHYELTVAMATIDGLGRYLYSNSAAVLAELIANAWDADATNVTITSTGSGNTQTITITDDGCGMSAEDLNKRFLTVGYRKRDANHEGTHSPEYHRPFMGRKGIGKLSVFSMADTLKVISRKKDHAPAGFIINYSDVQQHSDKNPNAPFLPTPLTPGIEELPYDHGTTIELSNLRRTFDKRSEIPLRTRIARRFDIFTESKSNPFTVTINGTKVGYEDREDLKRCEYVWLLGGYELPEEATKATIFTIPDTKVTGDDVPVTAAIRGWIGAVKNPKQLRIDDDDETLRNIIVLARSRPIQEGILDQIDFHQLFANYATGQLIADFLDLDERDDIATSDRQRLHEDDPRVIAFKDAAAGIFKTASEQWSSERAKKNTAEIFGDHADALDDWLNSITRSDDRKIAKRLLTAVARAHMDRDSRENRVALYQGAILAFDRMMKAGTLSRIESAFDDKIAPEVFLSALASYEHYEAGVYGQIIRDRIKVIYKLRDLVERHELENSTRDFVAEHPWLLNPAWERASRDMIKEQSFARIARTKGFEFDTKCGDSNGKRRLDLAFLDTHTGESLIIEFKRPGDSAKWEDLDSQIHDYRLIMTEVLLQEDALKSNRTPQELAASRPLLPDKTDSRIRVAVVVDRVHRGKETMSIDELNMKLQPSQGEAFTYQQMFHSSLSRYQEFAHMFKQTEVSAVLAAIEGVPDSDPMRAMLIDSAADPHASARA